MEIKGSDERISSIITLLKKFDRNQILTTIACLMYQPELNPHILRLEIILHLAFVHSHGSKHLSKHDIAFLYKTIGDMYGKMEDPPENIFTSNISSEYGNFVIFEGLWESGGYYLQKVVDIFKEIPEQNEYLKRINSSIHALLTLSTLHCKKFGLGRNIKGGLKTSKKVGKKSINSAIESAKCYAVKKEELYSKGFNKEDISEFILKDNLADIIDDEIGNSLFERFPVIEDDDNYYIALPTATSVAIRRFVYEKIHSSGWVEILLIQLYSKEMDDIFNSRILLGYKRVIERDHKTEYLPSRSTIYQLEDGVYFHVIVLFDPLADFNSKGFSAYHHVDDSHLESIISQDVGELKRSVSHEVKVYTLCIICGYGGGYSASYPRDGVIAMMSSADFKTLSELSEMSTVRFLSIMDYQKEMQIRGIEVLNFGGFINFTSHILTTGGRFSSDPSMSRQGIDMLMLGSDFILESRYKAACNRDYHVAEFIDGKQYPICRLGGSYFDAVFEQNTYLSIEHARNHVLLGLYEKKNNAWWLSIKSENAISEERLHDLWNNFVAWLNHIGPILNDDKKQIIERSNLLIVLSIKGNPDNSQNDPEFLKNITFKDVVESIQSDSRSGIINILIGETYFSAISKSENIAEKAFVYHIVKNLLSSCLIENYDPLDITNRIVSNEGMRHQHGFRQATSRLYFAPFVNDKIVRMDSIENERKKYEVSFRKFGKSNTVKRIDGKKECQIVLKSLMDAFIDDVVLELKKYNRHQLVKLALINHEIAALSKEQWTRTSRALTALYGDGENAVRIIVNEKSKLNAISLSSRIIVEFANCESKVSGGLNPGELTISKLMTSISILLQVAGISDAIHWDVIRPYIEISPYGDIQYEHYFQDSVIEPLGIDIQSKMVSANILNADSYYGDYIDSVEKSNVKSFEPEFLDALQEELDATFSDAIRFFDSLVSAGIDKNQLIIDITTSDAIRLVHEKSNLPSKTIEHLLEYFTLNPRDSWDNITSENHISEILPWRFKRKLSLIRKPIVNIHGDDLMIAPGLCDESFINLVDGFYHSIFPTSQLKSKMRKWSGYVVNRSGKNFAKRVSDKLTELGWYTELEVKITKILEQSLDKDYGDVDVLALYGNRVLIVECKSLQFRKTYHEIAEQLSDYRGVVKDTGKPDDLLKHMNRFDILSNNIDLVKNHVKINGDIVLENHLVFNMPVPMQYSVERSHSRISVSIFDEIADKFSIQ